MILKWIRRHFFLKHHEVAVGIGHMRLASRKREFAILQIIGTIFISIGIIKLIELFNIDSGIFGFLLLLIGLIMLLLSQNIHYIKPKKK